MLLEMVDIGRRSQALSAFFASKGHKRLDFELFNISVVAAAQAPNIMVDILSAAPPGAPAGQGISVFTAIQGQQELHEPPHPPRSHVAVLRLAANARQPVRAGRSRSRAPADGDARPRRAQVRRLRDGAGHAPADQSPQRREEHPEDHLLRRLRVRRGRPSRHPDHPAGRRASAPSTSSRTTAASSTRRRCATRPRPPILRSGRMAEKSRPYQVRHRAAVGARRGGTFVWSTASAHGQHARRRCSGTSSNAALRERGEPTDRGRHPGAAATSTRRSRTSPGSTPGSRRIGSPARNVVDGQLVRQTAADSARASPSAPPGSRLRFGRAAAISAEVARLDEIMDGIGDLAMSEAIYQVAAGDVLTAEAAMNFLPGQQPARAGGHRFADGGRGGEPPRGADHRGRPTHVAAPGRSVGTSARGPRPTRSSTPGWEACSASRSPCDRHDPVPDRRRPSAAGHVRALHGPADRRAGFRWRWPRARRSTARARRSSGGSRRLLHGTGCDGGHDRAHLRHAGRARDAASRSSSSWRRALGAVLGSARELAAADLRARR